MFFIDTVVENDSRQDVVSNIGIVELIMLKIGKEIPQYKRV